MKNNKGFTLIELLAVIVILAVLLAIAIPSVAKYINTSKKSTFVSNAQSYAKAARSEALIGTYRLPVNTGDGTVITFKRLEKALENGGKKSSYGGEFSETYSYVVIVNEGTPEEPEYVYYIAAADVKGYGIGDASSVAKILAYDSIDNDNVVQLGLEGSAPKGAAITTTLETGGYYNVTVNPTASTTKTVKVYEDNMYTSTLNN